MREKQRLHIGAAAQQHAGRIENAAAVDRVELVEAERREIGEGRQLLLSLPTSIEGIDAAPRRPTTSVVTPGVHCRNRVSGTPQFCTQPGRSSLLPSSLSIRMRSGICWCTRP